MIDKNKTLIYQTETIQRRSAMSQKYPKVFKNCAVCNFWGGARELDSPGLFVIVASTGAMGKCMLPKGLYHNQQRQASLNCKSWQVWPAMR